MLPLLLFVGLPVLEIILLVKAGDAFGFWWTVAWIFTSALIGIVLVRQQGMAAIARAQEAQEAGEIPMGAILTGIRLAFAGIFMIIPGFITDAMGLLLLLPWTGNALGRVVAARVHMHSNWRGRYGPGGHSSGHDPQQGETIDAEYEVVQSGKPPKSGPQKSGGDSQPPARRDDSPWQKP